ncbi:MAG TPA: acyl-CoA desaturase [Microbacteriaceae bacterium]|nr:acyl-CoA desaturase [Microbacteriaceae bacterium]
MTRSYTELSAVIRELGLLRRSPVFYVCVGVALVLGFAALFVLSILLGPTWWQLLVAAGLGILLTQVAFVAHEAGHRAILATGPAGERLARFLAVGVVGMSFSWWNSKHSRHHGNPNQIGKDPDIAVDTISFVEEDAVEARGVRGWITRRQGWLFFPLLMAEGINLHVLSVRHILSRRATPRRALEIVLLTIRFTVFLAPVFIFLPFGMACAFIGVQLAVFGLYMGASFAPNHKGMPILAPDARVDFFTKQVRTSRNIRGGWWATVLFGGLNFQIEHHLFPNMPRPQLARARTIVREYCERVSVPYTEESLWRSYGIVVRYLNRVGLSARDPFECHVVARYRSL